MIRYEKSLIFGVLALTIVGLLSFAGGRASNSVASKSSNNKTESSYNSNKNTNNGVDKVVNSNQYNNSYNNSISNSNNYQGSNDDISFELSEEDLANLKNGLSLTVDGKNVEVTNQVISECIGIISSLATNGNFIDAWMNDDGSNTQASLDILELLLHTELVICDTIMIQ